MIRALAIGAAVSVDRAGDRARDAVRAERGRRCRPPQRRPATRRTARRCTRPPAPAAMAPPAAAVSGPNITQVTAAAALAKIASGGGTMPAGLLTGQDAADVGGVRRHARRVAGCGCGDDGRRDDGRTRDHGGGAGHDRGRALRRVGAGAQPSVKRRPPQGPVADRPARPAHRVHRAGAGARTTSSTSASTRSTSPTSCCGEPIRDLDGNGEASNPGDGVGLLGEGGYVAEATAPFVDDRAATPAWRRTMPPAPTARAGVDRPDGAPARHRRAAGGGGRQGRAARRTRATEIRRIRAAVDDVQTTYAALRRSLAALPAQLSGSGGCHQAGVSSTSTATTHFTHSKPR